MVNRVVFAFLILASGCTARVSGAVGGDPGTAPAGTCVLPHSGAVDCSAGFSVDDGHSADVWQACADFGTPACPPGDGCKLGDEVGECSTAQGGGGL